MSIYFTVLKHSQNITLENLIQSVNMYFVSTLCFGAEDYKSYQNNHNSSHHRDYNIAEKTDE